MKMLIAFIVAFVILVVALGASLPTNHDIRFYR
jgi:hypothetical protein